MKLLLAACFLFVLCALAVAQNSLTPTPSDPLPQNLPDRPLLLRLRLKPGMHYRSTYKMHSKHTSLAKGKKVEEIQTSTIGADVRVLSTDPSENTTVQLVYRTVRLSTGRGEGGAMRVFTYDSTRPVHKPSSQASATEKAYQEEVMLWAQYAMKPKVDVFIGSRITMQLSPSGRITRIDGLDEINEKLNVLMNLPKGSRLLGLKQMSETSLRYRELFRPLLERDSIKAYSGVWFLILPEMALRVGDTWKQVIPSNGTGEPANVFYKLQSRAGGIATVKSSSSMNIVHNNQSVNQPHLLASDRSSGTSEGINQIEESTGLTKRQQIQVRAISQLFIKDKPSGKSLPPKTSYYNSRIDFEMHAVPS